ncbi:hypothetical protein HYN56_15870 [Flavobacterium crocinum]|uniref:Lipoprotein n=1 Tax=Flavobacterium crocinum TaxID=2183896 RepID=A0A2S1YNL4_9FLAO|nr:hypothetical protein [Flavobacterium crocinum]AWK05636.1 hypothetical protein HYN56_15870 [Flavobacterium crocinum]
MKILLYIKLVFLLLIACNNNSKKTEEMEKFNIKITFIGDIDKSLPILNFFDSCEETFKLSNYNYKLNYDSYLELKKEIQKQDSKIKENTSLIYILFNKKQYYLDKESSIQFISKLLDVTMYKNNEQLKNQLNLYLKVLKRS